LAYSFTETRSKLFWHYLFLWYTVPRKTQRVIRYGIIVIFLFYCAAALYWPSFYHRIAFAGAVHFVTGLAVLLPFINALTAVVRFKKSTYELLIDDNLEWIKIQLRAAESTIDTSEIKKVHAAKTYIRLTFRTNSYDQYLTFFKNETTEETFAEVREKLLRVAEKLRKDGEAVPREDAGAQ
jgi:hypothetical protein